MKRLGASFPSFPSFPSVGLVLLVVACGSTGKGGPGESGESSSKSSQQNSGQNSSASSGQTMHDNSTTVSSGIPTGPVGNKVDILFDIDNSASMGDKQTFLIQAIPEMVSRLVTPECIDSTGAPTGQNTDTNTGTCPAGSTPQFQPVHDMHIGVVTSSLGPRLGTYSAGPPALYVCDPGVTVTTGSGAMVSAFNDDKGHLINRTGPFGSGPAVGQATLPEGGGFLNWFPTQGNAGATPVTPPAAITVVGSAGSAGSLIGDFTEIVGGAGESGCGIESQLESWYRFLIQPDPYNSLVLNESMQAQWSGVDTTILQQRHDFLRPDSVVAIVVLTDENDSEIDVRTYQGSGYLFMSDTYTPPRATKACASDPNDPACAPCAVGGTDPNCALTGGVFDPTDDSEDWGYNLNLRHVHMMQKYAVDPQYPLTRYSNGLTSLTVPNRSGEYPTPTSNYTGHNNCTNPLFAAALPPSSAVANPDAPTSQETDALCGLPTGAARTPADVFYLHIGGVPHELLQSAPGDGTCAAGTAPADCPQKAALVASDWVKILGQGAASYAGGTLTYDYTGIDPHMIESMIPRNGSAPAPCMGGTCPGAAEPTPNSNPPTNVLLGPSPVAAATDPLRPDPINGREWTTYTGAHSLPVDREFACIFALPLSSQRDCATLGASTIEGNSCECVPGGQWTEGGAAAATGNTPDEISPLCSKTSTDSPPSITSSVADYTVQTYAKAYPTIRELTLANMLGAQGVVSSLCPIHTEDNAAGNDPLYGYRPAFDVLVSHMKDALSPAM